MASLSAHLNRGDTLHVWQKPALGGANSRVDVHANDAHVVTLTGPPSGDFARAVYVAGAAGQATLTWDESETAVSLIYRFDPARVIDDGVEVLCVGSLNRANPARYLVHLTAPFGWMNDPNGCIEFGGRTHVFYQHYPHAHHWDTMHWGHAVSANLVDWVHQPVFLLPRPQLLADDTKSGGAFSGSAIAPGDGSLRIFYTDREDHRHPEWEVQMTALSPDALGVVGSTPIIERRPPLPGFGRDLRDPYVTRGPHGKWILLLGGADAEGALVLLYESADAQAATGWHYLGVLHREPLAKPVPAECPCLIALDGEGAGLFALVFGLVGYRDMATQRRNLSFAYVGSFDGKDFRPIAKRELDFGTDCYAFQAFHHHSGPMGIAWAANWTDVRKDKAYFSAMTFPRRLIWRGGALHMPPAPSVHLLRQGSLGHGAEAFARGIAVPGGLAEIALDFVAGSPFRLNFAHASHPMSLAYDGTTLELICAANNGPQAPRYRVAHAGLARLAVYVDVGLIEIFVDEGQLCATKRIDSDEPVSSITLLANSDAVTQAEAWALRGIKR